MQVIEFILMGILFFISYQDFKNREVSLIFFPVALVLVLWLGLQTLSVKEIAINFLINTALIVQELFLVWLYFFLKERQVKKFVNQKIGLGDLLFIPVLAGGFSIGQFNVFIVFSLIIILLFWVFYRMLFRTGSKIIPLAGGWAILYVLTLLIDRAFDLFSRYNDEIFMNIIRHYNG